MKTTLRDQRDIVEAVKASTIVEGIKLLRKWLRDNGYEDTKDCTHALVNRLTGNCHACGTSVQPPVTVQRGKDKNPSVFEGCVNPSLTHEQVEKHLPNPLLNTEKCRTTNENLDKRI
jgi:hypothetical protein